MILKNFIVFEGLDGTGTTSQLRLLQESFTAAGKQEQVYFTAEPTGSVIGKMIREALSGSSILDQKTIAYLFGADRCEHIYGKGGILEQLNDGKAVFSDRYLFSSLAYQGLSAGEDLAAGINGRFPLPEYVFFFDLPAQTAMQRIAKRDIPREIYEKETFQAQVADAYARIFSQYRAAAPQMQIITINAAGTIEEIHKKIWSIVQKLPTL